MDGVKVAEIPQIEVDPVTLDIIEGALKSARFEMDAVLFRSAMSPVIREQHDEFPMITDPRGRMVVGQFGAYINEMMEDWDRGIYPGDVILTSDPFKCSASISHTNDWLVLVPIFFEDEIVGWSSQFGHQMDAGGRLPGSLPTGATTIFEEGLIIPPLKIVERGEVQEDILRLILNNVRLPQMNRADLFAIVAGCRAGEKRVIELCERFGKDVYLAALQALLDRTHEAMRKLIQLAIPEEPQTFEDWIDDDGLGNGPYKMKLTIWREGDHAFFDKSLEAINPNVAVVLVILGDDLDQLVLPDVMPAAFDRLKYLEGETDRLTNRSALGESALPSGLGAGARLALAMVVMLLGRPVLVQVEVAEARCEEERVTRLD